MPKLLGALHVAEHSSDRAPAALGDVRPLGHGTSTNVTSRPAGPRVFVYDGHAGGVGITERGFDARGLWPLTAGSRGACPCGRLPVSCAEPEVRQPERHARQGGRTDVAEAFAHALELRLSFWPCRGPYRAGPRGLGEAVDLPRGTCSSGRPRLRRARADPERRSRDPRGRDRHGRGAEDLDATAPRRIGPRRRDDPPRARRPASARRGAAFGGDHGARRRRLGSLDRRLPAAAGHAPRRLRRPADHRAGRLPDPGARGRPRCRRAGRRRRASDGTKAARALGAG